MLAPGAATRAALDIPGAEAAIRVALGIDGSIAWARGADTGVLPPGPAAGGGARAAPGVFSGALALALALGAPLPGALSRARRDAASVPA